MQLEASDTTTNSFVLFAPLHEQAELQKLVFEACAESMYRRVSLNCFNKTARREIPRLGSPRPRREFQCFKRPVLKRGLGFRVYFLGFLNPKPLTLNPTGFRSIKALFPFSGILPPHGLLCHPSPLRLQLSKLQHCGFLHYCITVELGKVFLSYYYCIIIALL